MRLLQYKYLVLALVLFSACQNKDVSFPDHKYNAVYFPFQYPLRTLILGDSRSDNSLDKNLQFNIGISIGGMYENKKDWYVDYKLDNSLVPANLKNKDGLPLKALPEQYYSLSPVDRANIFSGSFNGLIKVQLTDAFLDDPLAVNGSYVIPLVIVSSNADSVLRGNPLSPTPNRLVPDDWEAGFLPKDYTLFGIKYINPYHGNYFHRGKDATLDGANNVVSTVVYRNQYVERDQLWALITTGRRTIATNGIGNKFAANTKLTLEVSDNGGIVVKTGPGASITATGTGKYVKNAEVWGGVKHHAMYLEYNYTDGATKHLVNDTLVFRDNGVVFEENTIKLD